MVAAEVAVRPAEALAHARVALAALRRTHPKAEPMLGAWERILDEGAESVMQTLTSTSSVAVELRATSPFVGLIPDAVRDQIVSAFQAYWRGLR